MQVQILSLEVETGGGAEVIHPVLIRNNQSTFLVDTAYPGMALQLEDGLRQQGTSAARLSGIIITHHDIDHIGALASLRELAPQARVYASAVEARFIQGELPAPRLLQAEAVLRALPDDARTAAEAFTTQLRAIVPAAVDVAFDDAGSPIDGIEVVPTPGHTPGHISLFIPTLKTMIAGDAVV